MKKITFYVIMTFLTMSGIAQTVTIPNPGNYPVPAALADADNAKLGALIPRTMNLLHFGKKVKIAIYGQSLSDENNRWWSDLGIALKQAYPNADIDVRTFGVGGVSSNILWRLTNQALVAYSPDLVIFHVYGNHLFYETIVRQIRGCTGAEMIIQGDHFGRNDGTGTAGNWNYDLTNMSQWDNNMSFQIVKGYCDTYAVERDNRRQEWYDYLRANSYVPGQLLKDDVHFNDQGQWLVATLTARHFVYDASRNPDPTGLVKYYEVGKDVTVTNGKISFPFEGNKIELVPSEKTAAIVSATIDGKKPSEFPNCYYFTIPNGGFWNGAPFLKPGMGIQQNEDWTITMSGGGNFSLVGSKTGVDGTGNSSNTFISNSKRVVINKKDDWGNYGVPNTSGTYTFKSKGMFTEKIDFDTITYNAQKENAINVIQGVTNTTHTLELTSSNGVFPIKYIKVYKPYLKLSVTAPTIITANNAGGRVTIPVQGNTYWQVSHNSKRLGAFTTWNNIVIQNGSEFQINDSQVSMSCTIPALTGVNSIDSVYVYGQGCDVKVIEIRQGIFSGVENTKEQSKMSIYPNPVKDLLRIANLEEPAFISIYQLNGTLIKQHKITESGLNVSELPAGLYIVKIITNTNSYNKIIMKE